MLVLLPPSEAKKPPRGSGAPVDLDALSFPDLTDSRARVLDALVETSGRPDALARLFVGASVGAEVEQNTRLRSLPARPALEVYGGVLYGALDAATLSPAARRSAETVLVVVSALWGALRPVDRIPAYRLNICAALVGLPALEPLWREVLGPVLAEAAGPRGLVVDCRSSSYQAIGRPRGLEDRTVTLRVLRDQDGRRSVAGSTGKRVRGEVIRHLLESGADPETPEGLAEAIGVDWEVDLVPPSRPRAPWTMQILATER